jgi:hypothetical protein
MSQALVKTPPLRKLQDVRSKGGFAHYTGSSANQALLSYAGDARTPAEIFERTCCNLTDALDSITATIAAATKPTTEDAV